MTDWQLLKATASPSEMEELIEIELKSIKDKQMFHGSTPADQRNLIMKTNRELRKKAKKILKGDEQLTHRFMVSKTMDDFLSKIKKPKTQIKPETNSPVENRGLDTIVYKGDPDPTPESTQMRVPEFIEQGGIRPLLPEDKLRDAEQHNEYIETLKEQKIEQDRNSSRGLPNLLGISEE